MKNVHFSPSQYYNEYLETVVLLDVNMEILTSVIFILEVSWQKLVCDQWSLGDGSDSKTEGSEERRNELKIQTWERQHLGEGVENNLCHLPPPQLHLLQRTLYYSLAVWPFLEYAKPTPTSRSVCFLFFCLECLSSNFQGLFLYLLQSLFNITLSVKPF